MTSTGSGPFFTAFFQSSSFWPLLGSHRPSPHHGLQSQRRAVSPGREEVREEALVANVRAVVALPSSLARVFGPAGALLRSREVARSGRRRHPRLCLSPTPSIERTSHRSLRALLARRSCRTLGNRNWHWSCSLRWRYAVAPTMPRLTSNVVLGSALLSFAPITSAADSLCHATEVVRFNCTIRGTSKLVSVCSSPVLTRTSGYLQYRFGTHRRIELEFPSTTRTTQEAFTFEAHSELGDYEALNFKMGSYGYTVRRWVRTSALADDRDAAGVLVYRVGDLGVISCSLS